MVYKFKEGSVVKGVDAQVLGETLEALRIQSGGSLTSDGVLNHAKDPNSPIHNAFEWDDTIAAYKWRHHTARKLIQSVVVFF